MQSKASRPARIRKRAAVRFGATPELAHSGFTLNLSSRGLSLATQNIQSIQRHLFFEITVGTNRYKAEGVVVWSQRGLLIAGVPSSMGIRLTWAEDKYFQLLAELTGIPAGAETVLVPAPEISTPAPRQMGAPVFETVAVNGTGVTETLPDFITMLMDGSQDGPTPIEIQPLRERLSREPRFAERLPVEFGPGVLLAQQGTTLNLSTSGLALAAAELIEPGEMVVFTVRGRDGTVGRGAGEIAWAYSGDEQSFHAAALGIRVTSSDSKYRRILERISIGL